RSRIEGSAMMVTSPSPGRIRPAASETAGRGCLICSSGTFHYRFVTSGFRVAACAGCGLLARTSVTSERDEVPDAPAAAEVAWRLEPSVWRDLAGRLAPTETVLELAGPSSNRDFSRLMLRETSTAVASVLSAQTAPPGYGV